MSKQEKDAHSGSTDLGQSKVLQEFLAMGDQAWTILRDSEHEHGQNFGIYTALAEPGRRKDSLQNPEWDLRVTSGAPGFELHGENAVYRGGLADGGVEPIVLCREFYGAREDYVEIQQEFRLFHNLAYDATEGALVKPYDDGREEVAVKFEGNRVSVRTRLIKQYMAARQLDLHIYIDSVVYGASGDTLPEESVLTSETVRVELYPGEARFSENRPFSRLLGKKIIPAGLIESSGIWPFEEPEDYPEFIIGEDADGRAVRFTCDPDKLANYYGKNSEAPHYLTPVHFRKEVLQKYYERPELYRVSDGAVSCASLWSCRIDNDHRDRVVVFLGDLGRDLPASERDYWRGFMMVPDAEISETNMRRSFYGQFVEPKSVDLNFVHRYEEVNQAWLKEYGWPLFRTPEGPDKFLPQKVRLPLNDSQSEFEGSIRTLTQILIDSLNEREIGSHLEGAEGNEKGISKLRRFFEQDDRLKDVDVKLLRSLQEVRSKVTAHRKGRDYESVLAKNFGDKRGRAAIEALMEDLYGWLTSILESLSGASRTA